MVSSGDIMMGLRRRRARGVDAACGRVGAQIKKQVRKLWSLEKSVKRKSREKKQRKMGRMITAANADSQRSRPLHLPSWYGLDPSHIEFSKYPLIQPTAKRPNIDGSAENATKTPSFPCEAQNSASHSSTHPIFQRRITQKQQKAQKAPSQSKE